MIRARIPMPLTADWLRAIGPFPDRVPLEPRIVESVDCGAFTRATVSYRVGPDERIDAYLCLPKGGGPRPAVFCHHQHGGLWLQGKSEPVGLAGSPDLAYAKELAEAGYVTLTPDMPCFGARADRADPKWFHDFELARRLIAGRTLLAQVMHEVCVGIDLLQSLPEVDPARIGFIGHSYGGRTAFFAAAHDPRLKATVSNCGSTTFRDMVRHRTGIQVDFVAPGIAEVGDLDDLLRFVEPRAIMILAADQDRWSIGLPELLRKARGHFPVGELAGREFAGGHMFSREMREMAYAFLAKHLRA
jgi:dienelactone hydrolase